MTDTPTRILSTNGKLLRGKTAPRIKSEDLLRLYRVMLLNRRIDERMTKLQRQGRISFYIGSVGEEAAIVGSAFAMADDDWIVPCYREVGAALLRGFSLRELFCQLFGNAGDRQHGRQMPNHYAIRELRFASISSPVGTQISQATGVAMAARFSGGKEVTLVYFGDGATSQGDFHVGCNFAGVYKAPVVFFCRNNQWAISTPMEHQTASRTLAVKADAYGIEGVRVDGNDVLAVYEVTRRAVDRARRGRGPTLIEALTYRQGAHSTSDDPRAYREDSEVEEWKKRDPLTRFRAYLVRQDLWSDEAEAGLEEEIADEIAATLREVEKLGPPDLETLVTDVYDSPPWHLREQLEELKKLGLGGE